MFKVVLQIKNRHRVFPSMALRAFLTNVMYVPYTEPVLAFDTAQGDMLSVTAYFNGPEERNDHIYSAIYETTMYNEQGQFTPHHGFTLLSIVIQPELKAEFDKLVATQPELMNHTGTHVIHEEITYQTFEYDDLPERLPGYNLFDGGIYSMILNNQTRSILVRNFRYDGVPTTANKCIFDSTVSTISAERAAELNMKGKYSCWVTEKWDASTMENK